MNDRNDETPEAPPAREPGELVADIMHALSSTPDDHTLGEVKVIGASGPTRYLATAVAEWCRAQEGQPTEPPPLPDGWEMSGPNVAVGGCGFRVSTASGQLGIHQHSSGFSVPVDVVRHHLGLTAPAADVRALGRDEAKALLRKHLWGPSDERIDELFRAYEIVRDALTGKGAP